MNKRIWELVEQSGLLKILKEHSAEYLNGAVSDELYPEVKNFVDLIVADCFEGCAFPTDD